MLLAAGDSLARQRYARALERAGVEVVAAATCRELTALARSRRSFDVVVFEMSLQDGKCFGSISAFERRSPRAAVVVLAQGTSHEEIRRAHEAGASAVLREPLELGGLLRVVGAALSLARAYQSDLAKARARWAAGVEQLQRLGAPGAQDAKVPQGDGAQELVVRVEQEALRHKLSPRLREVLFQLVAHRRSMSEIAKVMEITPNTVKVMYRSLRERFGVKSVRDLRLRLGNPEDDSR